MNETLKNIITNPFVIGGTVLGVGIVTGSIIYAKHRPKTDAELALEKLKEENERIFQDNQHMIRLEELKNKQILDEIEAQEKTKRMAKEQEELTKRTNAELEDNREKREFEKNADQGYWDREVARTKAAGEESTARIKAESDREVAKIQADAAKHAADVQAKAIRDQEYYACRRQESTDQKNAANVSSVFGSLATMVSGSNSNS